MTERDKLITEVALATGMTLYMATRAVEIVEKAQAARINEVCLDWAANGQSAAMLIARDLRP